MGPSNFLAFSVFMCFSGMCFAGSRETHTQQWTEIGMTLEKYLWPQKSIVIDILNRAVSDINVDLSQSCRESLNETAIGLSKHNDWATQLLDSSSSFGPGILSGGYSNYGDIDQCLDITFSKSGAEPFSGKHCVYELNIPLPADDGKDGEINFSSTNMGNSWLRIPGNISPFFHLPVIVGAVCAPSTCSLKTITDLFNKYVAPPHTNFTFYPNCNTAKDFEPNFQDMPLFKKLSCLLIASFVLLATTSSCMTYMNVTNTPLFLKHFCIFGNTNRLLQDTKDENKNLQFLSGIRFTFLVVAAFYHVYFLGLLYIPSTQARIAGTFSKPWSSILSEGLGNIGLGMSVNFIFAGFLSYYSWFPEVVKTKGNLSFSKFVFVRWMRSIPLVLGYLLCFLAFPPWLGFGPVFRQGYDISTRNCLNNWWRELLFIGNTVPITEVCLLTNWILAADFQLYISSFLVVLLLYKRPKTGLFVATALLFVGVIVQGLVIHIKDAPAFMNTSQTNGVKMMKEAEIFQIQAYNYIAPYYMGLILAFLVVNDYHIESKLKLTVGWLLSIGSIFIVHYVPFQWRHNGFTRLEEIAFGAVHRPLYSLACTWFFFCCIRGKAGIFSAILSAKPFVILGRMSFPVYLGHYLIFLYDTFSVRQPMEYTKYSLMMRVSNILLYGIVVGYFLHILFEAPLINWTKEHFGKKDKPSLNRALYDNEMTRKLKGN